MAGKQLVVPTIFTAVDKFTGTVGRMSASVDKFVKNNSTVGFLKNIGGAADSAFDKVINLKNAAIVGIGGAALAKGYDMLKNIAEQGDEIQKTAQITGFATRSIQELQFAAMRENVANETLIGSFQKLNKNVGDLKLGGGALQNVLKTTNPVLLKQLRHVKDSEQAFDLLVAAIDKAPNTFKKTQLAQAAFGKSGTDMLKLIAVGPAGISALRKEANDLGIVIEDKNLDAFAKFADANDNLHASLKGLTFTIGAGLLPLFQQGVEKVTVWATQNRELIKEKVSEWATKIGRALEWTVKHLDSILAGLKWFLILLVATKTISLLATGAMWAYSAAVIGYNIAIGVAGALTGVANVAIGESAVALTAYNVATKAAAAATWLWGAAMSIGLWPLTLIVLAIGAVVAAVYLVIKYWNEWGAAATAVLGIIAAPLVFIVFLLNSLYRNWQMITAAFKNGGILEGIKAIGKAIFDALLMPLQQILQIAAKITGAAWISNAVAGLEKFRSDMGINVTGGTTETAPAVNPKTAQQEALNSTVTNNNNNKIQFDFKNMPDWVKVSGAGDGGNTAIPGLSSTMNFSG